MSRKNRRVASESLGVSAAQQAYIRRHLLQRRWVRFYQVIILVSSSQYRGEVERELNQTGRVGKRFLLAYHAPTKRPEANETITIGGKRLKQYFQNDVEFTEIKEIEA